MTLFSKLNGIWWKNTYTYTAFTGVNTLISQMLTPASNSTFTSTSGTFTWSIPGGVSSNWLTVGSKPGAADVFAGAATGGTRTVNLPYDGRPLFVTLWSFLNGQWLSNSYSYTAVDSLSEMTSPTGGSTLGSGNVTFDFTPGTGISQIWLTAGSTPEGQDLFSQSVTSPSQLVTLPTDGRRIFVKLWSRVNGAWAFRAYTYNAFSGADAKIAMTSPTPGSTFTSSSVPFMWTSGTSVSEIWLTLGSTPSGADIFGGKAAGVGHTVTAPTDGRPVYVALWSLISGKWGANEYIYTAESVTTPNGLITSPTNGSILSSGPLVLNWNAGTSASEYWLGVGNAPDNTDLYSASQGTNLSKTLVVPLDGRRIYVTLWSLIGGAWKAESYYYDTTQ